VSLDARRHFAESTGEQQFQGGFSRFVLLKHLLELFVYGELDADVQ
jgi:hypothetical protein